MGWAHTSQGSAEPSVTEENRIRGQNSHTLLSTTRLRQTGHFSKMASRVSGSPATKSWNSLPTTSDSNFLCRQLSFVDAPVMMRNKKYTRTIYFIRSYFPPEFLGLECTHHSRPAFMVCQQDHSIKYILISRSCV